jgi:hypothetical protein
MPAADADLIVAALLVSPLIVKVPIVSIGTETVKYEVLVIFRAIAITNVFDTVLALLFVVLALLLLIHRCIWPLLARSLFRMQEIGTKGRRGILFAAGLALLGAGLQAGKLELPGWIKAIIDAVKG